MLYSVVCIIFLFAHPLIRKKAYRFFWLSHQLYVLFYILCMLHGLARITAAPKFWIFIAFPGVVFTIDKVILITLLLDVNFSITMRLRQTLNIIEYFHR